jgi:hypothetical protein
MPLRAVVFDSAPATITPDIIYRSVPPAPALQSLTHHKMPASGGDR